MADRKEAKGAGRVPLRKKEKKAEVKAENVPENEKEKEKENTEDQPVQAEGEKPQENGVTPDGAAASEKNEEFMVEPMELPPFEIIEGERINSFFFKFQFKNVEYSSGRNKTFLCFLVDTQGRNSEGKRGYLEDEHTGAHSEEAFFQQVLPEYDPALRYMVTWYVSSSPCPACIAKLVEILTARKTLRLTIFSARLFMWEEPEVQAGLKALAAAGCKLRMMKPTDFSYTWDTFVDNEDQKFDLWEDCKENYEYYQEKLADILQ
ncbi:hypothetical protein AAFF_G00144770 [Aldrovandia affinis]|uniref:mRNA(cytosine(6666)) deaminase n=1 Tax=Aldrovandia affinis TaxID=143900 RepID=A0AAD7T0Y4_9TELE|nr:hypothetical protein AAFF_G00144770 [Aldrovandia affinis]